MRGREVRHIALVLAIGVVLGSSGRNSRAADAAGGGEIHTSDEAALDTLGPLLARELAGRIYYVSPDCRDAPVGQPVPFPRASHNLKIGSRGVEAAVRRSFTGIKSVVIKREPNQFVRIFLGRLPDKTILATRLSNVSLSESEQRSPILAIWAILNSTEVQATEKALGLSSPIVVMTGPPPRGPVTLPTSISDMTVDQAFDLVARRFNGFVLFGSCQHMPIFDVSFAKNGHPG
jgi:hypothetical protein